MSQFLTLACVLNDARLTVSTRVPLEGTTGPGQIAKLSRPMWHKQEALATVKDGIENPGGRMLIISNQDGVLEK